MLQEKEFFFDWESASWSNLVGAGSKHEKIEGDCGDNVNEKPAFEVVDSDLSRMSDHLILLVDVRRPEVDEYVDDEHDVDDQIDYCDRIIVAAAKQFKHSHTFHVY